MSNRHDWNLMQLTDDVRIAPDECRTEEDELGVDLVRDSIVGQWFDFVELDCQ